MASCENYKSKKLSASRKKRCSPALSALVFQCLAWLYWQFSEGDHSIPQRTWWNEDRRHRKTMATASLSTLVTCRKYSGGTDDRVQTAAAFVTLLRELGEDRMQNWRVAWSNA